MVLGADVVALFLLEGAEVELGLRLGQLLGGAVLGAHRLGLGELGLELVLPALHQAGIAAGQRDGERGGDDGGEEEEPSARGHLGSDSVSSSGVGVAAASPAAALAYSIAARASF